MMNLSPSISKRARQRSRRGQTLIMALAILFLFVLLGGTFVTLVARNLQRTGRQGESDDAVTLALAGLQHAAQQFRASSLGADWRPQPTEFLWRTPAAPPGTVVLPQPGGGTATFTYDQIRTLDPDHRWLSDSGTFLRPFVRVSTGRGRFLLRVTYEPRFRPASRASEQSSLLDEFDQNSGMIHIESIGRPGDFDPNDPSFLSDPTAARQTGDTNVGPFHKVEAFVPVALVDQLIWVTNFTNERGPATLGSAAFESGDGRPLEAPSLFYGAIRSEVDLQWHGRNVVRLYPARGDSLTVRGKLLTSQRGNVPAYASDDPQLSVEALDDTGQTLPPVGGLAVIPPDNGDDDLTNDDRITIFSVNADSDTGAFAAEFQARTLLTTGNERRHLVQDERHVRDTTSSTARNTHRLTAPSLNQVDQTTGIDRWLILTRDSGDRLQVQSNDLSGGTRIVNAGLYGLTDRYAPGGVSQPDWDRVRARGLYLPNFGDIQLPGDRRRIKSAWLKPRSDIGQKYGWSADMSQYVPATEEQDVNHPVAEVELTRILQRRPDGSTYIKPVIRVTRYDLDPRQMNVPPSTGRRAQFYNLTGINFAGPVAAGVLVPAGEDQNGNYALDPGEDQNANGQLDGSPFVRDFDIPENGVFYAEGSIRVRGTYGTDTVNEAGDPIDQDVTRPRPLTIVSRGTIYVEGNILKHNGNPAWQVGLLAHDYVALNPTAFTRVSPGPGVDTPLPDFPGDPTKGHHYRVDQGKFVDFSVSAAAQLQNVLVHVRHSGQMGDDAITAVAMHLPYIGASLTGWPDWSRDRYDFGTNIPPVAATPPYVAPVNDTRMHFFRELSPGDPNTWNESDARSLEGAPDMERKTFFLPSITSSGGGLPAGMEGIFRLEVAPKDTVAPGLPGTDQPYWFSRVAVTPMERPLPIRVEAVVYAFTGSWFVIPPPFFNDQEPNDTRANYRASGARAGRTLPGNMPLPTSDPNYEQYAAQFYPFYNEPLNVDVELVGAVAQNTTASPSEVAEWTRRTWTWDFDGDLDPANGVADNDPTLPFPPPDPFNLATWAGRRSRFSPRITYRYDYNLKRLVRARIQATGQEEVVWVGNGLPPAGLRPLGTVIADAAGNIGAGDQIPSNSYVDVLPLLPRLPASSVVYEGASL